MIRVTSITHPIDGEAIITAFADAKTDVTQGATFIGLPENTTITFGSSIITADGDVAFLKSNGTWNWI